MTAVEALRAEITARVPGTAMVRVRAFLRADTWVNLAEFHDACGLTIRVTAKTALELAALIVGSFRAVDWRYDHDLYLATLVPARTPEQDEGTAS